LVYSCNFCLVFINCQTDLGAKVRNFIQNFAGVRIVTSNSNNSIIRVSYVKQSLICRVKIVYPWKCTVLFRELFYSFHITYTFCSYYVLIDSTTSPWSFGSIPYVELFLKFEDVVIKFVKENISEYRADYRALGSTYYVMFILSEFKVSSFQAFPN